MALLLCATCRTRRYSTFRASDVVCAQVQTHADTAYYMGVISGKQRVHVRGLEKRVASLIRRDSICVRCRV